MAIATWSGRGLRMPRARRHCIAEAAPQRDLEALARPVADPFPSTNFLRKGRYSECESANRNSAAVSWPTMKNNLTGSPRTIRRQVDSAFPAPMQQLDE